MDYQLNDHNSSISDSDTSNVNTTRAQINNPLESQDAHRIPSKNVPHIRSYPSSTTVLGPTSIYDPLLTSHLPPTNFHLYKVSQTKVIRSISKSTQYLVYQKLDDELLRKQQASIIKINQLVHPYNSVLIELFFTVVHPYFPILNENAFLQQYKRSQFEISPPLLAIIYSLAIRWAYFDPKSNELTLSKCMELAKELQDMAISLFWKSIDISNISLIQAGLLILQAKEDKGKWTLCSSIVSIAENMGLGMDCSDWKIPKWEKNLRIRLAWALWMQEKWISLEESKISHLKLGVNWVVPPLTDENLPDKSIATSIRRFNNDNINGHDTTDPNSKNFDILLSTEELATANSFFKYNVLLSIILGDILLTFFSFSQLPNNISLDRVLKIAKPLQLKLREWYHGLPANLLMTNYKEKKFTSNATLTLSYFAVELTLHRKIISSIKANSPPNLINICRVAAKTRLFAALSFIRDLRVEHKLSFWYSNTTSNIQLISIFAALLYVTSSTPEEKEVYKNATRNYISILKRGAKIFNRKRFALRGIYTYLLQIPGLLLDSQDTTKSNEAPNPSSITNSVYQDGHQLLHDSNNIPIDILQELMDIQENNELRNGSNNDGHSNGQMNQNYSNAIASLINNVGQSPHLLDSLYSSGNTPLVTGPTFPSSMSPNQDFADPINFSDMSMPSEQLPLLNSSDTHNKPLSSFNNSRSNLNRIENDTDANGADAPLEGNNTLGANNTEDIANQTTINNPTPINLEANNLININKTDSVNLESITYDAANFIQFNDNLTNSNNLDMN
ncbi:hypothetical protein TBLA_0C00940 [Henningerozyma blattae CBS 6284]|uniref:Xylanolytic transcriptional activator regulatory domain-containing protein n=1 Tax=Henningerozyma blattae (strain ATCC 34711 / CBS 6284 / DSM 70876 / NBRC 10599 / NRRL Y-10934 / UCD 77-7) TaxID=1071380 RepID=I2H0K7_HENB6|nr:hypothetical protein TBLA_0C00940 [Tetrapisispora blattae CBS 6284]CCH59909.1 hypothetical protein TBLA_0C00940 [Tetrapisispora blattae CBS 6284]